MPDLASLKWIAESGALALLSAFMFLFYRKDQQERIGSLKQERDQLQAVVQANTAVIASVKAALEQNNRLVETLTGRCVAVQMLEGHLLNHPHRQDRDDG